MPRSATVRALGVLTAFAVIAGVAPAGPVAAQPTPPGVEAAPAATVEAAEDLLGDLTFTPPSRTFQGELTVSLPPTWPAPRSATPPTGSCPPPPPRGTTAPRCG